MAVRRLRVILLALGGCLVVAGCAAAPAPTAQPTSVLIPATVTDTATPVTPTPTRPTLPAPGDLRTPTATADSTAMIDPVAAGLAAAGQRILAERLNLPARRIRVVEITPVTWRDTSLGCPIEGQTYPPVDIAGYRLVLSVGGREYIFHADADRLIPCDAQAEGLTATVTAEIE